MIITPSGEAKNQPFAAVALKPRGTHYRLKREGVFDDFAEIDNNSTPGFHRISDGQGELVRELGSGGDLRQRVARSPGEDQGKAQGQAAEVAPARPLGDPALVVDAERSPLARNPFAVATSRRRARPIA
ncbi:MAG: hypothetical protein IT536_07175 [Hyphomicrobiales bacterium]|nr:hypothetical protein [Hyphomicrobiales bacterium]